MVKLLKLISLKYILILFLLMGVTNLLDVVSLSLFIPIIELFQSNASSTVSKLTFFFSTILSLIGIQPELAAFLILLCLLFFLKGLLSLVLRYLSVRLAARIQHSLREEIFAGYLECAPAFIFSQRQGVLLSILNDHTMRTGQAFFIVMQMLIQWFTVIVYVSFVFFISWKLSLIAVLSGLVIVPLIRWLGYRANYYGKRYIESLERVQHFALEALQAKKLINAMAMQKMIRTRFIELSQKLQYFWQWTAFYSNSPGIIVQPLSVMLLSLIIWMALRYHLSTAMLGAFVMAFLRLLPMAQSALALNTDLKANLPSINRVMDLREQTSTAREISGSQPFTGIKRGIFLQDITFTYDDKQLILDGLDLDIPKGSLVALVGPSGTGKTTIADLILGLYHPVSGRILIDNADLKDLDIIQFRKRVAYVPQEPILFHDTIRNNLILGLEYDLTDEQLEEVCKQVGAWDFINVRKDKFETIIGDRGVQLSGGQRQRLALARALLRSPELLILDEATSALDSESENWIKAVLNSLKASRDITIFIIAHRYTTIQQADKIYKIANGKAVLLGTWEQAKIHLTC